MYPYLSFLFVLSLFSATTEQILWRGDSSQLFLFPFFVAGFEVLYSLLFVRFIFRDGTREKAQGYHSPTITLTFIGLCLFSFYANLGQREYFIMAREPVGVLVYSDAWSLIALVSLLFSFWRVKKSWLFWCSALTVIVWFVGFWYSTQSDYFSLPFINIKAVGQYRLASCFLLLAYYWHNHNLQQTTCLLWRNKYTERIDSSLPVVFIVSLVAFAFLLRGQLTTKECVQQRDQYRISEEMALHLFVAEDPLYYYHRGVELHAMRIVAARFLETGKRRFGGSTISMQLAKVCYLSPERRFYRKLKQLVLGIWLEQKFNKRDILAAYLENIQFSPETRGLTEASSRYFQKTPSELNIEESLSLILSIQDPFSYNLTMGRPPNIVRQRGVVTRARLKRFRQRLQRNIKKLEVVADHQ